MTPLSAFLTLVVPLSLVAAGMLGISLLRRRVAEREEGGLAARVAARSAPAAIFAVAFWPADVALNQWHELWPTDGTERFLAVAVAAAVVGTAHAATGRAMVTALLRLALGAAVPLGLLTPLSEQFMPRPLLVALTVATALWLPTVGAVLDRADRKLPRLTLGAALFAAALAVAPGVFESGYAGGAQLAAALGVLGAGLALARLARSGAEASGAVTVWLALFAAILLVTYGYTEVAAWWPLVVMAAAPLGVLAGWTFRRGWARWTAAVVGSAVLAGGATAGAVAAGAAEADDSYYGY